MERLENSSAKLVFKNFSKISSIPRCSNHEEKISEYIYNFGTNLGLETKKDEFKNVLIIKPASKGYENHETICLQAHTDMVCEKIEGSLHDFTCDPIKLVHKENFITAEDTTLGADNGVGVSYMLSILEDNSLEHPRIEALFTATEETGMDGALGLSRNALQAKKLINIDNEEEDSIFIGCAGGVNAYITKNIETEIHEDLLSYEIKVSGLLGGHSGMMINEARENAIKLLDSLLIKIRKEVHFHLNEFSGGSKHNAIPSIASAIIGINKEKENTLLEEFEKIAKDEKDKLIKRELDLNFEISRIDEKNEFINEEFTGTILRFIQLMPHGVHSMDKELNIVKTSNNLAIVSTKNKQFSLQTSLRSSDSEDLKILKENIIKLVDSNELKIEFSEGYPMWKPNFESNLLKIAKSVFYDVYNKEAQVAVIHAGLETGIISEKYPNMDMISIGPNIYDAHTPNEKLSVNSCENVYNYIKELLKRL